MRSETLGVAAGWEPRSPALKAPTQNSLLHHLIAPNISQISLKYFSKISNNHKSTHPKLSCITSLLPLYLKNLKYFFKPLNHSSKHLKIFSFVASINDPLLNSPPSYYLCTPIPQKDLYSQALLQIPCVVNVKPPTPHLPASPPPCTHSLACCPLSPLASPSAVPAATTYYTCQRWVPWCQPAVPYESPTSWIHVMGLSSPYNWTQPFCSSCYSGFCSSLS